VSDHLTLGEKLFEEGRLEDAEAHFRELCLQNPKHKEALNNLGVIAFRRGEFKNSLELFLRCLEIDPGYQSALLNCQDVLRSLGLEGSSQKPRDPETQKPDAKRGSPPGKSGRGRGISRKDINTRAYWDRVYSAEIGKSEWRRNVVSFAKIKTYIGSQGGAKGRILDIGCGYGALLDELRPLGYETTGWDISPLAIRHIEGKGHFGRVMDFVHDSPPPEEKYEFVISTEMLEHMEDPLQIVRKMVRLAVKGVLLTVPDNCLAPEDCEEHLQCFSRESLADLLSPFKLPGIYIEEYLEEYFFVGADVEPRYLKRPSLLAILEKHGKGNETVYRSSDA